MTPWLRTAPWVFDAASGAVSTTLDDQSQWRVRFLGDTLARVTFKPAAGYREPRTWSVAPPGYTVPWEGQARDDERAFKQVPAVQFDQATGCLSTPRMAVSINRPPALVNAKPRPSRGMPLALAWSLKGAASSGDEAETLFCHDRATSAYLREQRTHSLRHYVQRQTGDRYYGLGDKTGPLNLHGRRLRTLSMDSLGYDAKHGDPLYKHWPFLLVRADSGIWYGVYYDTLASCTFDLGQEHDNYHGLYRYVDIDDGDLDYYLMAGTTPAEVVAQFVALVGGTALPPRWSVGFGQTAMGLADAPDAQQQLDRFIDQIDAHRMPVKSFHYGSGYTTRGIRRYVFTWNHSKFPDPKTLNARFHAKGLRVVANIKPALLDDHPDWPTIESQSGFVHHAHSREPVLEPFWDGLGAHLDFTNPNTVAWWQARLTQQVLKQGIDVGWNDNNEYAVLDETAQCHGFGAPMSLHRCRPLHALLMTRATYEAQQDLAPGEPVYTVTRAGPPGVQRYAQTWSGDNTTSWHTLRWNLRTGLQMSLSGLFNTGHDVGGFYGPLPDAELFLRWVQACCLNPRFVMNSWKPGGLSNLPWMHPEVTDDVRRALMLREHLMPYLWSLFERAHAKHEPIIRPSFFNFPDQAACFEDCDDFMLGADLLVAPVVEPGQRVRLLHLPALPGGIAWVCSNTGATLDGGRAHEVDAPLGRLPLFYRSDSAWSGLFASANKS